MQLPVRKLGWEGFGYNTSFLMISVVRLSSPIAFEPVLLSLMSMPPWDNLRATRLAWLSLNSPNYNQSRFPWARTPCRDQESPLPSGQPDRYLLPAARSRSCSSRRAPGALPGAACPWGMPSKPPLVTGCLKHCNICSLILPNPA